MKLYRMICVSVFLHLLITHLLQVSYVEAFNKSIGFGFIYLVVISVIIAGIWEYLEAFRRGDKK